MSGFVYIWFDRKHKRYYIGSHWGKEDDGYICSSRWMRKSYRRRPEDFKRRVISIIKNNYRDLLMEEQRWLYMISDNQLGKKYYNLIKQTHHWRSSEEEINTVKKRISIAVKASHNDPIKRANYLAGRLKANEKIKANCQTEKWKKQNGENTKRRWADPEYYKRVRTKIDAITRSNEHRKKKSDIMNHPDIKEKVSIGNTKAWQDPIIREKYVIAAKNRDPKTRIDKLETREKKRLAALKREAIKRNMMLNNPELDYKYIRINS